jgi:hypothetical protein
MRQGQGQKRSRGRGNSGRRNPVSRHNNFDSNGPSVRIRGTATQVYEKYLQLARDATTSGDRVTAENMFQHAEHYFRIINADREEAQAQRDKNAEANRENDRQQENNARQSVNEGEQPQETRAQETHNRDNRAQENRAQENRMQEASSNPEEQLPQFLVRDDGREKLTTRTPRRTNNRRPRAAADQTVRPKRTSRKPEEAEAVVVESTVDDVPDSVQPDIVATPEVSETVAGD